MDVSIIIPSYNNLQHLKNCYTSIKKYIPDVELILMDDGSTDGTYEWIKQQKCIPYRSEQRVGHTILYDKGIEMATNDIVGILHADMIIGPNYLENMFKYLQPGVVVCATRIEPPLHPEGKEKIIMDFGMDFDSLNILEFELYCQELQREFENQTTQGIFAPWILYKKDFQAIGGHDPKFAPYGYEDSDIFQRWILAGYKMIQSRDSFVYHLTCRGHRWGNKIGVDNDDYKHVMSTRAKEFIRKWGSWVKNDIYQHPIISPKYDIGFVVNGNYELIEALEPWCSNIYIYDPDALIIGTIMLAEQPNTSFNLGERVINTSFGYDGEQNEILVYIDQKTFTQEDYYIIQNLPDIIEQNGEIGKFNIGNMEIEIKQMNDYKNKLIKL